MVQKPYSGTVRQFLWDNCNPDRDDCNNHKDIVASLKCEVTLKAPRPRLYCDMDECTTLGDHLRRKRLHSNEPQGCVAQILGLTRGDSLTNWELNRFQPQALFNPLIIEYLGYTPLNNLAGTSLSKRIEQYLFVNGYSQKEVAKKIGVDPTSLTKILDQEQVLSRTKKAAKDFFESQKHMD